MGRARPTSQVPTGGNAVQGGGRPTTTKAPPIPLSQQTLSALLQFGIIVSGAQRSLHLSGALLLGAIVLIGMKYEL